MTTIQSIDLGTTKKFTLPPGIWTVRLPSTITEIQTLVGPMNPIVASFGFLFAQNWGRITGDIIFRFHARHVKIAATGGAKSGWLILKNPIAIGYEHPICRLNNVNSLPSTYSLIVSAEHRYEAVDLTADPLMPIVGTAPTLRLEETGAPGAGTIELGLTFVADGMVPLEYALSLSDLTTMIMSAIIKPESLPVRIDGSITRIYDNMVLYLDRTTVIEFPTYVDSENLVATGPMIFVGVSE